MTSDRERLEFYLDSPQDAVNLLVKRLYPSPLQPILQRLYYLLVPEREKVVTIDGSKFRINTHRAYERGLQFGHLEGRVHSTALDPLEAGDVFVDVGGWIGDYAIPAARAVGDEGRVISFEPDSANAERLRENVALNGLENVTVVEKAVYDREGRVGFTPERGSTSRVSENGESQEATTLDAALSDVEAISVLKLDVEGAEIEALSAAEETLEKTRHVLVECHPKRADPIETESVLRSQGFEVTTIERGGTDQHYYWGESPESGGSQDR